MKKYLKPSAEIAEFEAEELIMASNMEIEPGGDTDDGWGDLM